jgi:formylglycine-generating enzyme required for sulfatase activity
MRTHTATASALGIAFIVGALIAVGGSRAEEPRSRSFIGHPSPPGKDPRSVLRERSLPADPLPAYVTFTSTPPGATVIVNGKPLPGRTPVTKAAVPPVRSKIEFKLANYESVTERRSWSPSEVDRVEVRLRPRPAYLTLTSSPAGATIWVNGQRLVKQTPTAVFVPPGRNRIEFHRYQYEPVVIERAWGPNAKADINVTLLPPSAHVTFVSFPPGATVTIDGEPLDGRTPIEKAAVQPGRHRIEFSLDDHAPVVIERAWRPKASSRVEVRLRAFRVQVTFRSMPEGATVVVDGQSLDGTTPIEDMEMRPGRHTVEFRLPNHETAIVEAEWQQDETAEVDVDLRPLWSRVTFSTTPQGASVSVDGRRIAGTTPIENIRILPTRSTVEFHLDGYEPVSMTRAFRAETSERVEVHLKPVKDPGRVYFRSAEAWERLEIDGDSVAVRPTEPWTLAPGSHVARAFRGDEIANARFEVESGEDVDVELTWGRWRPDPERYALLPRARAVLGSEHYAEENPPRTAEIPGFWIARSEVTVEEYRQCVKDGSCERPDKGKDCNWKRKKRTEHPINCVSARDAEAYAAWLSRRDGLAYELPTVDQWERAARGTTGRRYPWGDDPPTGQCNSCDRKCRFHHFKERELNDGWSETAPVGTLTECASPEGITDLVGNVAEWCRDESTTAKGRYAVRGGSWGQIGAFLDPSFPSDRLAASREPTIGFRLVVPELNGAVDTGSGEPPTDRAAAPVGGEARPPREPTGKADGAPTQAAEEPAA